MAEYTTPKFERWQKGTDTPLLLLAVGSLPLLVLELFHGDLNDADKTFLDSFNVLLLVAFGTDYVTRLALAQNRSSYARAEWMNLVIVLSQGAVVATLQGFGVLRAFRGLRALRPIAQLFRIFAFTGSAAAESRGALRRNAGGYAFGIAGVTWLSSAVAFSFAEDVGQNGREGLTSFGDALWWSATTMATVGYGDIAPETAAGRTIAIITMIVGIATFATVTAKVAEFLVRGDLPVKDEPAP